MSPHQAGEYFAGHQFGIGAGHINISIGILQQTIDRFFPIVDFLYFIQQKGVTLFIGHFPVYTVIHIFVSHVIIKIL